MLAEYFFFFFWFVKEVCNLLKVPASLVHDHVLMLYLRQHPKVKAVSYNGQTVSCCIVMFLKYVFKIFCVYETDSLFTVFVLTASVGLKDGGLL
jgi:hypothetical protein